MHFCYVDRIILPFLLELFLFDILIGLRLKQIWKTYNILHSVNN